MGSIADVTPENKELKLSNGKTYTLNELTMLDYRDGEKILGRPRDEWGRTFVDTDGEQKTSYDMTAVGVLLYLMARKHGVPPEEQAKGIWPFTLEEFLVQVSESDLIRFLEEASDFLTGGSAEDTTS